MLRTVALFLLAVGCLNSAIAQEKPAWTANPSFVYQQNKAYPNPFTVRLFPNDCYDKNGNVTKPLKSADAYTIVVTGVGVSASAPIVGECSLTTTLSITPATQSGLQMLTVKKGNSDAGFAHFELMDATAGPTPAAPEVDVQWEVLTDHLCSDNFGNHMPADLYCIETTVGNNSGHTLQLAGIGFLRSSPLCKFSDAPAQPCTGDSKTGISTPNVTYLTARGSAQAGQSTTARNIVVNGTQAVGLLMGSFTPFFLNNFNKSRWATGASIIGTSLAQAINIVAPDQTIREINNLDDQAFRDGKIIPNNTQVRLLVFVQKRSTAEAIGELLPTITNANEVSCTSPIQVGYKKVSGRDGKCYPAWEDGLKNCVKKLACDPIIVKLALGRMVIVGDKIDFIQRVVVDPSVTSQAVNVPVKSVLTVAAPVLSPTHGSVGTAVTLTGTGFGATQGTVKFGAIAASPTSWSDTTIVLNVPAGTSTGDVVVVVTVGGVDSKPASFSVDPPSVFPILSPTHGAIGTAVTLTGTGFGATQGTVKFAGIAAPVTSWTDTKIVVNVPVGATTGNVVVAVGGVDRSPVQFAIP